MPLNEVEILSMIFTLRHFLICYWYCIELESNKQRNTITKRPEGKYRFKYFY